MEAKSGSNSVFKALVFRTGQQLCALPLGHVVETMRPLPLRPVAGAPAGVLGLALIRGSALPVIDVGSLIGHRALAPDRFIAVRAAERRFALCADAVVGIRDLPAEALQTLPPLLRDADSLVVENISRLDNELVLLLDGARLLPPDWEHLAMEADAA